VPIVRFQNDKKTSKKQGSSNSDSSSSSEEEEENLFMEFTSSSSENENENESVTTLNSKLKAPKIKKPVIQELASTDFTDSNCKDKVS